jgi:CheY-like chemotaxis protein
MDMAFERLNQVEDPALNIEARVALRCRLAKELEESGDLEGARASLSEFWQRVGDRPRLDGLDKKSSGEVLLAVGRLTGSIGSARQIEGAQETAKDLISESIAAFEDANEPRRVCEALIDLALCYWRQGALDEARVTLRQVLRQLGNEDSELKAVALLRSAIVEKSAFQHNEALRIYTEAAPLFEASDNNALRGKFHNGFANVLENLSREEDREDYRDRALLEYAAASFHFEQAGHTRYCARVENNLGFLFFTIRRFAEAHSHLDRARRLFDSLKDSGSVAQVDDTRARTLIAEGRYREAEKVALAAVNVLENGGEHSLLAEALTTRGVALARMEHFVSSNVALARAIEIAELAGDPEAAGRAALTLAEELGDQLSTAELARLSDRADSLFAGTRSVEILARLNSLANRVIKALAAQDLAEPQPGEETFFAPQPLGVDGFSLKKEVGRYEAALIERALKESGGIVSRAAQMLGFTHYQTLIALLNNRHKDLLHARTPIVPRRRSIIRLRGPRTTSNQRTERRTRPVTILHVEDNGLVADAVKETLELEGWHVVACSDGDHALAEVKGNSQLDLLLLDNNLPGLTGVELLRRARSLAHRRDTPIVMLSATECEEEAFSAGADAFLRKPQDISVLVDTISRLLESQPVAR